MPDLSLTLNLDQPFLAYRRVRSLAERLTIDMDPLTGGATYAGEIRLIAAGAVATAYTAAGYLPRLVLKVKGPVGDIELARLNTTDFTVLVENSVNVGWTFTLPLTTAALIAFFADKAEQKFATLEITLFAPNGDIKPLYLVNTAVLAGYITQDTAASDSMTTPIIKVEGEFVLNQLFGQIRLPYACTLLRAQLALEDAPVGAAVIVELVKPDGTRYGANVTVADGASFGETVFSTPVAFAANADVRGKPTSIGSTNPGGFGTLTLFLQKS